MDGTVKLPGVGPVKKGWALGGAAVLAGILAVAYYRHAKTASTAAAASAAGTSGTQDPNAIDPATGLTYAEEAAGIQAGDLAGYGTGYGDTSGLVGYAANGQPVYSDQVGYGPAPSFVNNASWAQAAQQYLVSSTDADAGTVAAALGAYLSGQVLTSAQASVVQSAIAFFGQPPDAGSSGYPPSLRLQQPHGGTPPPKPRPAPKPAGTVTVPDVVGQGQAGAFAILADAGLHATGTPTVKGKVLIVRSQSPRAGTKARRGSTVKLTSRTG